MPTLKDLSCSIELSESQRRLQEFGTTYGDGYVETFVPVPSKPQSFSIHLTSDRFIAPGISMYVFVDGVYQCNRNRQDLKLRKGSDSRSVVDLRVRQKEEKQKDGSMIAREWKFEKLDTSSADDAPDVCSSNILDNIGCIEVLVLRCAGTRNAKTASTMNMDGTSDFPPPPPPPFGPEDHSRTPDARSMYDDRSPQIHGSSTSAYHSPYAETVNSQDGRAQSRYSVLQSHGASPFSTISHHRPQSRHADSTHTYAKTPTSIPSAAFQYGSGPIPTGPMMGSERSFYHTRPASVVVANAPAVDKAWLDDLVTKAVQRGVEESRRVDQHPKVEQPHASNIERASQPLGAWPKSPFNPGFSQHGQSEAEDESATTWGDSQAGWSEKPGRDEGKAHVSWDAQTKWDSDSRAGGWEAPDETGSETWDTDQTWGTKHTHKDKDKDSRWSRSSAPTVRSKTYVRDVSPATTRRQSQRSRSQPRSTKRSHRRRSSTEDENRWTQVDRASDALTNHEESDDTAQPSHHRSDRRGSRARSWSRKRSHHTKSDRSKTQRSSRHLRGGADRPATSTHSHIVPDTTPMKKDEPLMVQPPVYQTASWVPTAPEVPLKNSFEPPSVPPPPFSIGGGDQGAVWPNNNASKVNWDDQGESGWEPRKADDSGWSDNNNGWEANDVVEKKDYHPIESSGWATSVPTHGFEKDEKDSWVTQDTNWTSTEKPNKPNTTQWDTTPPAPKPPTTSKRHTTKSLSQYRKPRTSSSSSNPKSHWQFPPPPTSTTKLPSPSTHSLPPEPLLKLSSKQATEKGVQHQVRAGPGSAYGHAISRPEYLDTLSHPYAVFRFKYRSRAILKGLFGEEVKDKGHLTVHTGGSRAVKEKEKLKGVGREELVERLVGLKMRVEEGKSGGRKEKRAESERTESVARGLTESWVKEHSREASVKGKESEGGWGGSWE